MNAGNQTVTQRDQHHPPGAETMAFQNEYVPQPEAEASEFFRAARGKLRLGFSPHDKWTVDRDRDLVLVRTGRGSDIESQNDEYFTFLRQDRTYRVHTTVLESRELDPQRLRIVRKIRFVIAPDLAPPTPEAIELVKEALTAYKDYGVISQHASCVLILKNEKGQVL